MIIMDLTHRTLQIKILFNFRQGSPIHLTRRTTVPDFAVLLDANLDEVLVSGVYGSQLVVVREYGIRIDVVRVGHRAETVSEE